MKKKFKPPPPSKRPGYVQPPAKKREQKFSVLWNGDWHIVIGKRLENGNVEWNDEHGRTFCSGTHKAL